MNHITLQKWMNPTFHVLSQVEAQQEKFVSTRQVWPRRIPVSQWRPAVCRAVRWSDI